MNRAAMILWSAGLLAVTTAGARTIVLTQTDTTMIASIGREHPFSSWMTGEYTAGYFGMGDLIASPQAAVLLQFSTDRIPKAQRIVSAELAIPVHIQPAVGTRLCVWRLLAGWGPGVSYVYRQVRPERLRWANPGGRGPGVDRAVVPTRVFVFPTVPREARVDVTADVQLWYRGTAPNHGWMISTEDDGTGVPLLPPLQGYSWTLQMTYEPE